MAYRVIVKPAAERQLKRLDREVQRRLIRQLEKLADDPHPVGTHKLRGSKNLYRMRVGDYRIVYEVQARRLMVLVVRIGHRRDVYRER